MLKPLLQVKRYMKVIVVHHKCSAEANASKGHFFICFELARNIIAASM